MGEYVNPSDVVRVFSLDLRLTLAAVGLTLWSSLAPLHANATERLTLKVGPFDQTIALDDLKHFTDTGELSPTLQRFAPLLTPELRSLLNQTFAIDRNIADRFLADLLNTRDGQILLEQLQAAIPHSTTTDLRTALYLTLDNAERITPLTLLSHYPQAELVIDLPTTARLALQLKRAAIQSQFLTPIMARELAAPPLRGQSLHPSFDPTQPGPQAVRQRSLVLTDDTRQRQIKVDLHYSANPRGPLIVLSHGFAADRRFMAYLANHLASYGFSVASLEHPGSNIDLLAEISLNRQPAEVLSAQELVNRPLDVQFLLDELESLNENWPYIKDKFNTTEVVVVGHSSGGYTAIALAGGELDLLALRKFCQESSPIGRAPADWLQCSAAPLPDRTLNFRDRRVVQVVALNPVTGHLFGEDGLSRVDVPTLILSNSRDAVAPPLDHQLQAFEQLNVSKYFVTILGATHMSITDESNSGSTMAQSTLVQEVMGAEAEPVRNLMRGVILAFVEQRTENAMIYRPFLTPYYVQSQSTPQLTMRLATELPLELSRWVQVLTVPTLVPDASRSLLATLNERWVALQHRLHPPQSCRGQLDRIFTDLLSQKPV